MSSFLEIARPLAERGLRVFPVIPKDKRPLPLAAGDHFDAATTDIAQLEQWNRDCPTANVGIAPDENFCFFETDSETEIKTLCADLDPEIWDTTRFTSGRPDRACYVFRQTMRTRKVGNMTASRGGKDNLFEFKQYRVLVVGPGSIHPKIDPATGVNYVYTADWRTIPAMPDALLNRACEIYGAPLATEQHKMDTETQRQTGLLDKFLETYEVATAGDWFSKGKQWYRPVICPWDATHENTSGPDSTCVVYTEGGGYGFDCKHRCAEKGWKEFRAEVESHFPDRKFSFVSNATDAKVLIGPSPAATAVPAKSAPLPERKLFDSYEDAANAPPVSFLIEGFLQCEGVTGLAAPVRERKSLLALNVAHSLVTGEKLFGHFEVTKKPTRVIYLCPEISQGPFYSRVRDIGLLPYCGKTLLCRTLSTDGHIELTDAELQTFLPGSVVILDTAIRFLKGSESDSEDVRAFADVLFGMLRGGAESVLMLHHTAKGTATAEALTLENALRGSGDLGAFMACCYGTRLQDPDHPYESLSFVSNLKQRDFESKNFLLSCDRTCKMRMVGEPSDEVQQARNNSADKDGRQADAETYIQSHAGATAEAIVEGLAELGIKRSPSWVYKARKKLTKEAFAVMQANGGQLPRRGR